MVTLRSLASMEEGRDFSLLKPGPLHFCAALGYPYTRALTITTPTPPPAKTL
jgi:hypothetical protein